MSVTNQSWYAANAGRQYPLDETASCVDDRGAQLPTHILADARICFPNSLASHAFLGALSITAKLVTTTILGADDPDSVDGFVPLAVVSLRRPVTPYRLYPITALAAGVTGWLVFGAAVLDDIVYRGLFSSPSQSRLLRRAARGYVDLPIPTIGKLGNKTALTGLVRLSGGSDIEIVEDCLSIPLQGTNDDAEACGESLGPDNRASRRCIVFRLKSNERGATNVLSKYVGACGKRPESGNCDDPQPVERIGGVSPDCDGTLTIEFRGAVSITEIVEEVVLDDSNDVVTSAEATGIIIDSPLALTDTCGARNTLPAYDGRLPSEIDDICEVSSMSLGTTTTGEDSSAGCVFADPVVPPRLDYVELASFRNPALPFRSEFEGPADGPLNDWNVVSGNWTILPPDTGTGATDARVFRADYVFPTPTINIALLSASVITTASLLYKQIEVRVRVVDRVRLIFGYKDDAYHYLEVRAQTDLGVIYGYHDADGDHEIRPPSTFYGVPPLTEIMLRVKIFGNPDVADGDPERAWVYAELQTYNDPSQQGPGRAGVIIGTGGGTYCLPQDGQIGVGTVNSIAEFIQVTVDNL